MLNQHTRTDIGTVFSTFVDNTGSGGRTAELARPDCSCGIPLYVMLIGLLNAQYTLTGFDASAHMSEETHDAERSAPRGIIWSVIISVIVGFILLVAMNIGHHARQGLPGGATAPHDGQRLRPRAQRPACRRRRSGSTPSARPAACSSCSS